MRYYSTRKRAEPATFARAALSGLAPDGGLYVPEDIPPCRAAVKTSLPTMSFLDIAFETLRPFMDADLSDGALRDLCAGAFTFDAPLRLIREAPCGPPVRRILELFHGPTAAFKDFGARFMARMFSYLRRGADKPLDILVATSGDTGGAVAAGFSGVDGVRVTVLYPQGRVSPLQEKQIAGLGGNIFALAVQGSFDDCQRLVKAAFACAPLREKLDLSSANSINIARLLPQAVYHCAGAAAFLRAAPSAAPSAVLSVPSGNFGNLVAGLYAQAMGAPIARFIAATNINKTIPDYLESGVYRARHSEPTISNAMDVGDPSNYERLAAHWTIDQLRALVSGAHASDEETRQTIRAVHTRTGRILDPHSAVAWKAADALIERGAVDRKNVIVLGTAHPAKFAGTVEPLVGPIPVPPQLAGAEGLKAHSRVISASGEALLDALLG
ncbi:MAG: threonine synthase [Spirochaetaceae bacterium]|nr:threonine synthase [Spirochaetaceae bacterium]